MKLPVYKDRPLIMGIVNVTPDSFSGDGLMQQETFVERTYEQVVQMLSEGVDIIDIGGESTRPGSTPVSADEEIRRVVPVIENIRHQMGPQAVLSIDTTKAAVADAALRAGADMINDVSALEGDPAMAEVAARHACPIILMHNRAQAEKVQHRKDVGDHFAAADYENVVEDVTRDLAKTVEKANKNGILSENILLDPGLGFGKNAGQNLALIQHISAIKKLGFPVLIGPSRKSFIGLTLGLPVDDRLEGTAAAVALCAYLGADIIRVHDVRFMSRVSKMAAAIKNS